MHRNAGAVEHAHLLGLVVVDASSCDPACRGGSRRTPPAPSRASAAACARAAHPCHPPDLLADAVEIAGHELEPRVPERRAAAVDQRHPAVEVGGLVVARDGEHVVGIPRQLAREIRRLDAVLLDAVVVERPDERRSRVEVLRQLGKPDVIGVHAGDDLVADLPDRRVVVAEEPRRHFLGTCRAVLLLHAHQRHVAADVLAQQLVGLEQVVLVVLLEHARARRLGERSEMNGRRIHGRRDVHEAQVADAARKLQFADVAHERDVGVVDGDGQLDLIVECRLILNRAGNWILAGWRCRVCGGRLKRWRSNHTGAKDERGDPEANRHGTAPFKGQLSLERSGQNFLQERRT